jgi:Xaa-Pro dipeptidase
MFELEAIQATLREFQLDGWLLYDFRGSNVLAQRVLELDAEAVGSRRFFYCIPASGTPRKLVHRIESDVLNHLPGEKTVYLRWQELEAGVAQLIDGLETVAMEYSPNNANPYISRVDAGTVELVRRHGIQVVSSGDLVQRFEATWSDEQWRLHLEAAEHTNTAFECAWTFIADQVRKAGSVEESAVRAVIMDHFAAHNMVTYHPPIVAVGENSGNPHYETGTGSRTTIRSDDFVLIDLWAKLDQPMGVYSDLTRVGYVGETVPSRYDEIFRMVAAARDAAIDTVRNAFRDGRPLQGWEVDQTARDVIQNSGNGEHFVHRTGHSIGQETHGNGANMDNLETHEERLVMPRTCFSIEPGIYLPEFGIRSEVNVFIDAENNVHVTGGELQTEVLPILTAYPAQKES